MSGANWEIHGGVRYPVDISGVGYRDDGWTRSPTDTNTIVCGGQEYSIVRNITGNEANNIKKRWIEKNRAEKKKKLEAVIIIQKYARMMISLRVCG